MMFTFIVVIDSACAIIKDDSFDPDADPESDTPAAPFMLGDVVVKANEVRDALEEPSSDEAIRNRGYG